MSNEAGLSLYRIGPSMSQMILKTQYLLVVATIEEPIVQKTLNFIMINRYSTSAMYYEVFYEFTLMFLLLALALCSHILLKVSHNKKVSCLCT